MDCFHWMSQMIKFRSFVAVTGGGLISGTELHAAACRIYNHRLKSEAAAFLKIPCVFGYNRSVVRLFFW
jgi:hypothetical protein